MRECDVCCGVPDPDDPDTELVHDETGQGGSICYACVTTLRRRETEISETGARR